MKKKYHLEVIRILAILMVMYNHSAAFMSFSNQSGVEYAISFLFSMVCKGAVPLFFMVSGALLLGKMKVGKICFKKDSAHDSCNCDILVPVLYETGFKRRTSFCTVFVSAVTADGSGISAVLVLYSYLGVLTILPILRPLAQNMSKNTFWYLIILQILLDCLKPTAWVLWGYGLCGYYNFSGLFQYVIFIH